VAAVAVAVAVADDVGHIAIGVMRLVMVAVVAMPVFSAGVGVRPVSTVADSVRIVVDGVPADTVD
jgi:uncharacterized protein (DUF934 family)